MKSQGFVEGRMDGWGGSGRARRLLFQRRLFSIFVKYSYTPIQIWKITPLIPAEILGLEIL